MQDFETEEQQIEALKGWWKENASSLLIGLAIGGFSIGGWSWYKETQYQHSVEASDMYVSVVAQSEANTSGELDVATIDKLIAGYSDTPYAALSALVQAKHSISAGKLDQATARLQWVVDNAVEDEVAQIARLRLVRLMISQKSFDEADKLLSSSHPKVFDAIYEELKGDVFVAKGELEQARIAYDKAIAGSDNPSRWLKLKRQDLGSSSFEKTEMVEPSA